MVQLVNLAARYVSALYFTMLDLLLNPLASGRVPLMLTHDQLLTVRNMHFFCQGREGMGLLLMATVNSARVLVATLGSRGTLVNYRGASSSP
ncbi:unnamed protein product [Sphagnum jensenii]